MRTGLLTVFAVLCATPMCGAQTAYPGSDTNAGARPGNIIGTGMSLPHSQTASNLNAATTRSELAPNLPAPAREDGVRGLLAEAKQDLLADRTGAAQEALERAETRALDRSVAAGTERVPDQGFVVQAAAHARTELANGNIPAAIQTISGALRQP